MAQTLAFETLKHMTVTELREIAGGIPNDAIKGHSQMNKEHLLEAICHALKIDMHAHHEVVGVNKLEIKAQIRQLKKRRDEIVGTGDHENLHMIRRRIHHLKREIHKATV
jgi:glutamate mutase epsilon subunit